MEVQPEIVLEPGLEIKKSNEVHQESVLKQSPKIKEVVEVHEESILKPSPKIEKVTEVHQKNVLEPSPEIKKAMEVHQESFLKHLFSSMSSMSNTFCHPSSDHFILVGHTHVLQQGPVTGRSVDAIAAANSAAEVALRLAKPRKKVNS